uniref:Uncharacterized protein n=1 Tax=Setaria digitata TaxID=48799 RepID=A0A915PBQ5_9BILA
MRAADEYDDDNGNDGNSDTMTMGDDDDDGGLAADQTIPRTATRRTHSTCFLFHQPPPQPVHTPHTGTICVYANFEVWRYYYIAS